LVGSHDLVRPSALVFNDMDNLQTYGFEPSDEEIVGIPMDAADQEIKSDVLKVVRPDEPRLPAGLLPYTGVRSDHFKIWQTPSHEWESLYLAVYFEDWPNAEQQRGFRAIVGAWSSIAQAGGFGGKGGPHVGDFQFLKKHRAAVMLGDLHDTDCDAAVPVLIRLLENYASGTLAIEAVVFGLDPNTNLVV
jgi:hypothetical protein